MKNDYKFVKVGNSKMARLPASLEIELGESGEVELLANGDILLKKPTKSKLEEAFEKIDELPDDVKNFMNFDLNEVFKDEEKELF